MALNVVQKMTALLVQSRFAGLKIEDDDYPTSGESQKSKKNKATPPKKTEPTKKIKPNNKNQQPNNQLKKKKQKPQVPANSDQWELWKQKDEEMVDGNFESELQQAILLSKLDFEKKKDVYKQTKKDVEIERKIAEQAAKNSGKKQKKKNVMSLDQFNDMVSGSDEQRHNHEEENHVIEEPKAPEADTEFFDRVRDEAKNELLKDKIIDRVRLRQPVSDEIITRVQFADALERKEKEIENLKQVVTSLKEELLTVKSRNKKLYNILGQGEMKDKAEVLVEVERLRAVQTELTEQVAALHTELERERSRNTDSRAKDKKYAIKKKRIQFDVSSEALLSKEKSC